MSSSNISYGFVHTSNFTLPHDLQPLLLLAIVGCVASSVVSISNHRTCFERYRVLLEAIIIRPFWKQSLCSMLRSHICCTILRLHGNRPICADLWIYCLQNERLTITRSNNSSSFAANDDCVSSSWFSLSVKFKVFASDACNSTRRV